MKKWILAFSLILCFNANAANTCGDDLNNNCWDCGKTDADNCTARLDGTKLTITGDGNMADYSPSWGQIKNHIEHPWGNNVTSVEIEEGIKSIGDYAFFQTNLSGINIPTSVERIGQGAVQSMSTLKSVTFAENSQLEFIGAGAFNDLPNLTEINIPQSVKVFSANAFNLSGINSVVLNDSIFTVDGNNYDDRQGVEYFYGLELRALSDVDNIYCSDAVRAKCEEYFNQAKFWEKGVYYPIKEKAVLNINNADGSVDTYQYGADGAAAVYRNGKLKTYKGKRIFTIEEAEAISKKEGNSFRIRYR
ncbi:MAG: leucine-rich repeat domain-containing protein [Alphaproteobacteria bacterium]|nr:leucine-rich repeat domain-containing protein [Alphaproteobacteria bacterium]